MNVFLFSVSDYHVKLYLINFARIFIIVFKDETEAKVTMKKTEKENVAEKSLQFNFKSFSNITGGSFHSLLFFTIEQVV